MHVCWEGDSTCMLGGPVTAQSCMLGGRQHMHVGMVIVRLPNCRKPVHFCMCRDALHSGNSDTHLILNLDPYSIMGSH